VPEIVVSALPEDIDNSSAWTDRIGREAQGPSTQTLGALPATGGPSGLASLAPFLSYAPILRTLAAVMLFPSFATSARWRGNGFF